MGKTVQTEREQLEQDLNIMKDMLKKELINLENVESMIEAIYFKIDSIEERLSKLN